MSRAPSRFLVHSADPRTLVVESRRATGWSMACIYMLQALRAGRVRVAVELLP